ncbi:Bifunctional cytochrome P450/NADPH--P450 reductase 1 (CYP102A2) (Fatty acid hydroxylase CypD) (Flavocytochrome P450 102A2) [Includes: Cytochrome P450 102A2, partial [Durusdinium trenchii]
GALCRSFVQESPVLAGSFAAGSWSSSSFFSGPRPPFLILWGGEFRTTQSAAQDLAKAAQQKGFTVDVKSLDEVKPSELLGGKVQLGGQAPLVLLLVATYNGHPPENAAAFTRALAQMPDGGPSDLKYAVLGVGNSQWVSTFVKVARDVDKHLQRAGAMRILPFEVADKNESFEQSVRAWRKAILSMFATSPEELILEHDGDQYAEVIEENLKLEGVAGSVSSIPMSEHFLRMGYQNCKIGLNKELCFQSGPESPSVKQIVVERPDGCSYACGDHLEVQPKNSTAQVMRACMRLGCQSDALVILKKGAAGAAEEQQLPIGQPISVGEILTYYVDLQALPSQEALASLGRLASRGQEADALQRLSEIKQDGPYEDWKTKCLSILDVLEEFRSISIGFSRFVEVSPKIQPRLYSIASSPRAHGTNVELCMRVATYEAQPLNQPVNIRNGLCSSMIASAESVICRVKEAPHMRLPEDHSKPIACVCGGTGLAPFFGFLQERDVLKKTGVQTGLVHLYFGCRNETDFLHRAQLEKWHAEGLCSLKVSFSRPPNGGKEYVYHALRRDAELVLELLGDGPQSGYVYICGSASTLAKDVTNVLGDLLCERGDAAVGFGQLNELQERGRVIFDVWG